MWIKVDNILYYDNKVRVEVAIVYYLIGSGLSVKHSCWRGKKVTRSSATCQKRVLLRKSSEKREQRPMPYRASHGNVFIVVDKTLPVDREEKRFRSLKTPYYVGGFRASTCTQFLHFIYLFIYFSWNVYLISHFSNVPNFKWWLFAKCRPAEINYPIR